MLSGEKLWIHFLGNPVYRFVELCAMVYFTLLCYIHTVKPLYSGHLWFQESVRYRVSAMEVSLEVFSELGPNCVSAKEGCPLYEVCAIEIWSGVVTKKENHDYITILQKKCLQIINLAHFN